MEINWLLIASFIVAIVIEIGLPVTLAIVAVRKFKVSVWVVVTGVLTFIGSQVVHLPLLQGISLLFANGTLPTPPEWILPYFNAIFLGLMAGLCEETARLIGFKILKAKAKPFNSGLALGIGHGGIESVIMGVFVLISLVSNLTSNSALQTAQFWATPWHIPLAGGVERIIAVSAQIFMSVLVWKAVVSHNYWWFVLAILYHTVLDALSVYLMGIGLTTWQLEGALSLFFFFNIIVLWRIWIGERRKEKAAVMEESALPVDAAASGS